MLIKELLDLPFEYGAWKGGRLRDYIAEWNNCNVDGKGYLDNGEPVYTAFPPITVKLADHKITPEEAETIIAIDMCMIQPPKWALKLMKKVD